MAKKLKKTTIPILFNSGNTTYRISDKTVLIDSGYCRVIYNIGTAPYMSWSMMIKNAKDKRGDYEKVLNVYANAVLSVLGAMPNKDVIEALATMFDNLLADTPPLQRSEL